MHIRIRTYKMFQICNQNDITDCTDTGKLFQVGEKGKGVELADRSGKQKKPRQVREQYGHSMVYFY